MISWIKGDLVNLWQINSRFFILINCQGIGYEIQILESFFIKLKTKQLSEKNIILWIKHIKKEDSDSFYGFISKDQKDFFIKILNIKGIGSQIGMALLNKFTINQILNAIEEKDKNLICTVQGIGQKMSERIILELKNKLNTKLKNDEKNIYNAPLIDNTELTSMLEDINITLKSLNYPNREIKKINSILTKELKNNNHLERKLLFEDLLKQAMNYLDKNDSNLGR